MPKKLTKPKFPTSLKKSKKYPYINWKLDFDYLHKLSPKELEWLGEFVDAYTCSGYGLPTDKQREAWRDFRSNKNDLHARGMAFGGLRVTVEADRLSQPDASDAESSLVEALDAPRSKESASPDYVLATFSEQFKGSK